MHHAHPIAGEQRGQCEQHRGDAQARVDDDVQNEMMVKVDERHHDRHRGEEQQCGQRPRLVEAEHRPGHHCGECHAGQAFDQRVAHGDGLLAMAAFRAEHQPGDDGDVVVPCDLRLAVGAEAAFGVHDADVVGYAPDHHVEERADDGADHQRGDHHHHGGGGVEQQMRLRVHAITSPYTWRRFPWRSRIPCIGRLRAW